MRFLLPIALAVIAFTQSSNVQPDRWRGLILDQTTIQEATQMLGSPSNVRQGKRQGQEIKYLEFKKIGGFDKVGLEFLHDKLTAITLIDPDKPIEAKALSALYALEFEPKISGADEALTPRNYERHEGKVYPRIYPSVYSLVASSKTSTIECLIMNGGVGSILRQSTGITDNNGFPGKVKIISLLSRARFTVQGGDILSADAPATPSAPKLDTKASPAPKKICAENGQRVPCPENKVLK